MVWRMRKGVEGFVLLKLSRVRHFFRANRLRNRSGCIGRVDNSTGRERFPCHERCSFICMFPKEEDGCVWAGKEKVRSRLQLSSTPLPSLPSFDPSISVRPRLRGCHLLHHQQVYQERLSLQLLLLLQQQLQRSSLPQQQLLLRFLLSLISSPKVSFLSDFLALFELESDIHLPTMPLS